MCQKHSQLPDTLQQLSRAGGGLPVFSVRRVLWRTARHRPDVAVEELGELTNAVHGKPWPPGVVLGMPFGISGRKGELTSSVRTENVRRHRLVRDTSISGLFLPRTARIGFSHIPSLSVRKHLTGFFTLRRIYRRSHLSCPPTAPHLAVRGLLATGRERR